MGEFKHDNGSARALWASNVIIIAPALGVATMSTFAFDPLMAQFLAVLAALLTGTVWCTTAAMRVPWQKTWQSFTVSSVILLSVFLFLPMRVVFYVSRPSMDVLAARISQGSEFDEPFRAGLYRFESGGMRGPMKCLWTDSTLGDLVGFCLLEEGNPADHISEWSIAPLGGGWYHIVED